MKLTRRQIAQFGLMGLGALGAAPLTFGSSAAQSRSQKILVLGGTGFLGPHIVRYAVSRGHTLTLFNRGKTDAHLFPELEKLKGNRGGDLKKLQNRKWDVVIDTSSSIPKHVANSVALLEPNVGRYIYISSTAVYKDWTQKNMNEDAPIYDLNSPDAAKLNSFQKYGANKAMCETKVRDAFGERSAMLRPNSIVGPGHRRIMLLPYWVRRASQGGEILGPGAAGDSVQYIDARDLAEWIVYCAENSVHGTFTASSAPGAYSMQQLIEDCQKATDTEAPIVWVDSDFLGKQGFFSIPFWVRNRSVAPGFGHMNIDRAVQNGLQQRPKIDTTRFVYDWFKGLPAEQQAFDAGITREFEQQVIAGWRARQA